MSTDLRSTDLRSTDLRSTYRIQLHAGYTLEDAAQMVDYLADLGVSHLYCSPYLQAVSGSTHGYDAVNHHQVNRELGGSEALARLSQVLMQQGMGQVLDIVPNHMAISPENPWWWDVLENGPSSQYASYFDVEWDPPEARHSNAVLVPVLGDHYGRVLEAGEICLEFSQGWFVIRYYENVYPVDPRSLSSILAAAALQSNSKELAFLADAFGELPLSTATDRASARRRSRDQIVLRDLLARQVKAQLEVDAAIHQTVEDINANPDALDAFLELQNYRLAFWRITRRELGYRRFFDINTLIGLRMEDEQIFTDTHALVFGWLAAGLLDGLRIDHPDGLRDPDGYFERLHEASPETWVVIEKIIEPGEHMPASWPVAGTTGYDFMYRVNGLFVDPASEKQITDFYGRFTGQTTDYPALVRDKKLLVINEVLGSDLNRLVQLFLEVCERNRRYRDYTRNELREAISEVAACLPVYRTYMRAKEGQVHETDVEYIGEAIEAAKANLPELDPELFDFFRDLLLLKTTGEVEAELVMRFQQFTGPVMAKGVEDTTFYNFYRLISLNEVGGNPGQYGLTVEEFHCACAETMERWPRSMLATSTHDTKRSEDVRARINVLSEIPDQWMEAVQRWSANNERYRKEGMPDRNDEYLLYQTLVGAWPIEPERVIQYMEKACREAKVHTSWTNPNQEYEEAVASFVKGMFEDRQFRQDLKAFVDLVVEPGRINSLSQALIKLTAPGIPDIYQGTELWNLSLVDPDNRRPVDYELRRRLLDQLKDGLSPEEIWARADEGLPKLWVIRQALSLRRRQPDLFGPQGSYRPLPTLGTDNGVAFMRGEGAITVVPRLATRQRAEWAGTTIELPPGSWVNELTGEQVEGGKVRLADLLARFPVCLLSRVDAGPD